MVKDSDGRETPDTEGDETPAPGAGSRESGSRDAESIAEGTDGELTAAQRSRRAGQRRATVAVSVGGVLVMAAMVIGVARPEWPLRLWDASNIPCGRAVSEADPEEFDSPWAVWGEADHGAEDSTEAAEVDAHRDAVEELAQEIGLEPVAEIPRETEFSMVDGPSATAEVTVEPQGDQLRLDIGGSDMHRIAAVEPASGEAAWHWDLDDGRDAWIAEHGEHLVLVNRVLRGPDVFEGTVRTDMISLAAETGERQGCRRFEGSPGYGAGSTDAGLVIGTVSWNPMVADEEQDDIGGRSVQQVTLPGFSRGFTEHVPALEYEDRDGMARTRPQPLVTLQGGIFLRHAFTFGDHSPGDILSAASSEDSHAHPDLVPVEALSMDTGEELWSFGDPGDRIAFISGVPAADEDGTGVLVAEIGEFEPSDEDPSRGTSSVTLRMLDSEGQQIWETPAADFGSAQVGDRERFLRVLGDVILVHVAPDEVAAIDARTGETLWSLDESGEDLPELWLHVAFETEGKIFIGGTDRSFLIDKRTGEHSERTAAALDTSGARELIPLGEDLVLLETERYGSTILRRQ